MTVTQRQATIGESRDVLTVIFEFDIDPDDIEPLTSGITDVVENVVSEQPGFVSANLHVSADGEKVLNYFQWESRDAFEAFRNNTEIQETHIKPVIGPYGPTPRVYDVVYSAVGSAK